jgi:hypothetical protein
VTAGEKITIKKPVSINSIGLNVEEVMLLSDGNKTDGIDLSFEPPRLELPLNGTVYSEVSIVTSDDVEPKRYNDIAVNITRGLINPSNPLSLIDPISYTETIAINVLRKPSILFDYGGIFFIPFGITSIVAFFI